MESAHTSYAPPVEQLLTYGVGQAVASDKWPDYLELGLGPEQIPELIRMASDEELNQSYSDTLEVWAPLHAWRALGQLRAEVAIEPLIALFAPLEENEWAFDELPEVLGMIGPAALPALANSLADTSQDESTRKSATMSIQKIGEHWPEARSACVELLMKQLELFDENDSEINEYLVASLVELHATEAAPLMEQAFAAGSVAEDLMGDWEDVQVELGLLPPDAINRPLILPKTPYPPFRPSPQTSNGEGRQRAAVQQKKNKNKMAKLSRKKNRKR